MISREQAIAMAKKAGLEDFVWMPDEPPYAYNEDHWVALEKAFSIVYQQAIEDAANKADRTDPELADAIRALGEEAK